MGSGTIRETHTSLEVVDAPLAGLHPHPRNPRTITPARLAQLCRTLDAERDMLRARPIVALPDGTVIAGNQRLAAALELGWDTIPTVFADIDDERAIRWMLLDNRGFGADDAGMVAELLAEIEGAGADLLLTGYETGETDRLLRAYRLRDKDPDDAPPLPAGEPRSRRGEVYELGAHRLMCGDATSAEDVATLMDGATPTLVFSSLPYALDVDYGAYEDTIENLREVIEALAVIWRDAMAGEAYMVLNYGDIVCGARIVGTDEPCCYPMALEYWPVMREAGWLLDAERVWTKPHARVHAPWVANSNRAATDWEHIWAWRKPGTTLNQRRDPSYFGTWEWRTLGTEHVDIGREIHPAGFPTYLPRAAITVYSDVDDPVADPCAGTGTTLIAAEITGRRCFAMEIDPAYCDVIRDRYEAFVA